MGCFCKNGGKKTRKCIQIHYNVNKIRLSIARLLACTDSTHYDRIVYFSNLINTFSKARFSNLQSYVVGFI